MARAAAAFRPAGRHAYHFARGKLRHDPVFRTVLARGLVPDGAHLVDLGCGQGVLAAFLAAAEAEHAHGWVDGWAPPARLRRVLGVDLRGGAIAAARIAVPPPAEFVVADVRAVALPACDAVAIFDVLHYLPFADQQAMLARCAAALRPGGVLLLRIGDAAAPRFWITRLADQLVTAARGSVPRLWCRPAAEWIALARAAGFAVEPLPASAGTPFSNVLLVARRGD